MQGNGRSEMDRIAVNSGADGGEGNRLAMMIVCQFQTAVIGRCQEFRFTVPSISIAGSDGMDDIFCMQLPGAGDNRTACRAPLIFLAQLLHDRRPACVMNCPIHAAASRQMYIGCIDNRINVLKGDVAMD